MKNLSIFIILASLLFSACSEKMVEQNSTVILPDLTVAIEEGFTRTYVEGKTLHWHADDYVSVFYGNTVKSKYKFQGKDGDRSGTFSFVSSTGQSSSNLCAIYSVYPYQDGTTIADDATISLELPSIQKYSANSFGKGANTMIGVSENVNTNSITFKNACGYLKLKLYGGNTSDANTSDANAADANTADANTADGNIADGNITVKSIVVKGNNDERIAGSATAIMVYDGLPSLTMSQSATKSVTIDCGDGVALGTTSDAATEFWFVLPVIEFTKGISIIVTTTDGNIYEKSTSNTVSITRNEIQPMATLLLKDELLMPEDNEIRYTTTDKNKVEPSGFSQGSIISKEYVNGQGVITFGSNVTSIPNGAFANENCTTLSSIFIPSTVESIGKDAFFGCKYLTAVYCLPTDPPTIDSQIFDPYYIQYLTIYVPAESVELYKGKWGAEYSFESF